MNDVVRTSVTSSLCVQCKLLIFFSTHLCLQLELPDHLVGLFQCLSTLPSRVPNHGASYRPTSKMAGRSFPDPVSACYCLSFGNSSPGGCKVGSHCGFEMYFLGELS